MMFDSPRGGGLPRGRLSSSGDREKEVDFARFWQPLARFVLNNPIYTVRRPWGRAGRGGVDRFEMGCPRPLPEQL